MSTTYESTLRPMKCPCCDAILLLPPEHPAWTKDQFDLFRSLPKNVPNIREVSPEVFDEGQG